MKLSSIIPLDLKDFINYLENELFKHILREIKECKILGELDFQYRILQFFENKIKKYNDSSWRIHNTFYLKESKKYPDLILFKNLFPYICIELKYSGFRSPNLTKIKDDIIKLNEYFKIYPSSLHKGYSINMFSTNEKRYNEIRKILRKLIIDERVILKLWNLREQEDYIKMKSKTTYYKKDLRKNSLLFNQ